MVRVTLLERFAELTDPRVERTRKHRLCDILFITLCALVCGATTFEDIEEFAEGREAWLKTILKLENGIPSHDTIYRVLCALDAKVFAECFRMWMGELCDSLGYKQIAIDGKSVRGAKGSRTFTGCVHLVGAWATEHGLILGQESVAEGSNEAATIPILLKTLHLKGSLVSIDAAGCQKGVAEIIRERGGDYLLAVKGNQPKLQKAVEKLFADACDSDFRNVQYSQHSTIEDGHGRHEQRYITVLEATAELPDGWKDVATVIQVNRERTIGGVNGSSTQYYISSMNGSARTMGHLIRRHWAIENELHWVLDVTFGEDANRTGNRNASANLGIVRRTAISLLKQEDSKISKPRKAFRAALNTDYLEKVLRGIAAI